MELPWFYSKETDHGIVILDQEESHHCSRVLRLGAGAGIMVTDGRGHLFEARIMTIGKKQVEAELIRECSPVQPAEAGLTLAVAPTRNLARYEWVVEKAVEIGVKSIIPLICDHSERNTLRSDRIQKIIISAAKQSRKPWFPDFIQATSFSEVVTKAREDVRLIALCAESGQKGAGEYYRGSGSVLVLIGPEGDFSQTETEMAFHYGFQQLSLGNSRLRTETAALTACAHIQFIHTFAK